MYYLAIDIGGTYTKYAIMTIDGEFQLKGKFQTVLDGKEDFLDSLINLYETVKQKYEYKIAGIALSIAGMVDSEAGYMYKSGNLNFISNCNIVEYIEKRIGVPVTMENDAKCAAYAEMWKGSLRDVKDAIVLVCGTGVGGAVIVDRKILSGSCFMAGEFSYILTETKDDYELNHILGARAGIRKLLKNVANKTGIAIEQLDGIKIFELANKGNVEAIMGIRQYAKYLAVQIHNCYYILNPERFVIGGGISAQPLFLQILKEEVEKINKIFPWELPIPQIVACQYQNDANLIGAVYVHIQRKIS